jgi:hypothetical protein
MTSALPEGGPVPAWQQAEVFAAIGQAMADDPGPGTTAEEVVAMIRELRGD